MGYFSSTFEKYDLKRRVRKLRWKKRQIGLEMDYATQYAAALGSGSISLNSFLKVPAKYSRRLMYFLNNAHNGAIQYANQNSASYMQSYMGMSGGQNLTAEQQQKITRDVNLSLYTQAREQALEIEKQWLHQLNTKLEQEKEQIDDELEIVQKRLEYAQQEQKSSLQDLMPTYS